MARVTHVKKAQQRYRTVPVLNPDGTPKTTTVTRTVNVRDAAGTVIGTRTEDATTKRGKTITRAVTVADRTQPLPNYTCDSCRKEIEVGTPYKHISPRSGPYGGRQLNRHETCPTWHVWEYSSSLSARIAQIQHAAENALGDLVADSNEDYEAVLAEAAESVRDLAGEKAESAQNIEDGFGHTTTASEELTEQADALEQWADDIESADLPEYPEAEEADCDTCGGSGKLADAIDADQDNLDPEEDCRTCNGEGTVTPDEPTEQQIEDWRTEASDAVTEALGNCPL